MTHKLKNEHTSELLAQVEDKEVRKMAHDVSFLTALTKVINSGLGVADEVKNGPAAVGLAMGAKVVETVGMADTAVGGSKALSAISAIGGIALSNKALAALSSFSPAKAAMTVGLVTLEKTMIAGGLQEKHKCGIAIGALAATGGLALASVPTVIGGVIGVVGTLAAGADAYNKCYGPASKVKD